ncbi:uncharacterized protein LOC132915410 [Bombus pascuorum]|uniref:uncharacterized protein LOC132915410 n=1 Tax=Bombus pascuorum TaxID=65598 RepID=UPI002135C9EC|nr:uncharacterized protein LOC132915410 [Bombus pascuorum]XP_060831180.1 uncharacterized protein LOC132915410 [Bombus pascuorum]
MSDAVMQELKDFHLLTIGQSNCTRCIEEEKKLDIAYLNEYTEQAHNICKLLEQERNSIITIDAPSGFGKTSLLCTFVVNYQEPVKFIVFRKDQASEISLKEIETYTSISFCMHHLNLPYQRAIQMFQKSSKDKIEELYKLILYSKKFVAEGTSVLILDTYTIPSPAMLLLLYILSLKHELHLIFAGDAMQLSSVNKSVFHKESNYYIIQILKDLTISNLNENMRIHDTVFRENVADFYELLQQEQPAGNVPLNYKLRYHLYTMFRSKYFTEERFDTIYIAQTHRNITKRLYRFIDYLKSKNITYYEAPFLYGLHNAKFSRDSRKDKHFPTLLIVKGYKYIYINEEGFHHVVVLEDILLKNDEIVSLKIRFLKDKNRVETIVRVKLNYYQILPDYRNWLFKNRVINNRNDIWQFPLRPYTLTYHATLGRTIDEAKVELSAECMYANFLHIGLCSVRHDFDIHKIHDERNLAGYLMTQYMETLSLKKDSEKYYYRCQLDKHEIYDLIVNNKNSESLDNIEWMTTDDIHNFEKNRNNFIRIERSKYEQSNKKVDTPFMQITKFIKENPHVILNTIEMAPVDDFDKYCNKEKKKKKQPPENEKDEKSHALCYLLHEYDQWVVKKEKDFPE